MGWPKSLFGFFQTRLLANSIFKLQETNQLLATRILVFMSFKLSLLICEAL